MDFLDPKDHMNVLLLLHQEMFLDFVSPVGFLELLLDLQSLVVGKLVLVSLELQVQYPLQVLQHQ